MDDQAPHVVTPRRKSVLTRRGFIVGAGVAVAGTVGGKLWIDARHRAELSQPVTILKAHAYDEKLEGIIRDGLATLGIDRGTVAGRSVMLKPNLVEPSAESPHINTHPAFIRAAVEVFRRMDASEVFVAEGQGHIRDSRYVLEQSGVGTVLDEDRIPFVDLNHDAIDIVENGNPQRHTRSSHFYMPQSLKRADLVVSLPKMKVHHWAGVTLSMKNLFGVMPSICYGWPKNLLHIWGINNSIMDITATVQPDLAIVDGVIGMEGDGPIMGTPRPSNMVFMGLNPVAVDATGARLMGFDPNRIPYLKGSDGVLGYLSADLIEQRGEKLQAMAQRFELVEQAERQFRA